jgi:iron-sulfur cluster insertion protein
MEQSNQSLPFSATEAALKRITYLLSDEPEGSAFVVEVQGGGCSGFQYHFDLKIPAIAENDLLIEQNGAKLVVDATSLELLKGSTLDYVENLAKAGFELKNPNATMKCGCGNSFSVM